MSVRRGRCAGGKDEWQSGNGDDLFIVAAIAVWFLVTSVAMGVFGGQSDGRGERDLH